MHIFSFSGGSNKALRAGDRCVCRSASAVHCRCSPIEAHALPTWIEHNSTHWRTHEPALAVGLIVPPVHGQQGGEHVLICSGRQVHTEQRGSGSRQP